MNEHRSRLYGNLVSILKSRMIMKAREEIIFSRYIVNAQKDFRMAIGESFKLAAVQAYAENKG